MNIYDYPNGKISEEITYILYNKKNVRIEKIVSQYNESEWYDQEEDEWFVLLKGYAEIEYEDKTVKINCGETLYIPAHVKHRVSKTTECIWLCVFIKNI